MVFHFIFFGIKGIFRPDFYEKLPIFLFAIVYFFHFSSFCFDVVIGSISESSWTFWKKKVIKYLSEFHCLDKKNWFSNEIDFLELLLGTRTSLFSNSIEKIQELWPQILFSLELNCISLRALSSKTSKDPWSTCFWWRSLFSRLLISFSFWIQLLRSWSEINCETEKVALCFRGSKLAKKRILREIGKSGCRIMHTTIFDG